MNKNCELAIEFLEKAKELFENQCWDVMSEEWAWYLQVENLLREIKSEGI